MKIEYFGTDLQGSGHFLWELEHDDVYRNLRRIGDLPFNPEALPYAGKGKEYRDGTVVFYHGFAGFTICAIAGSCSDKRPGSKSIFFIETNDYVHPIVFKELLLANACFQKMMKKMSFEINW